MTTALPNQTKGEFPFTLEDLSYWVIKRKDGTIIRYNLLGEKKDTLNVSRVGAPYIPTTEPTRTPTYYGRLSEWCDHKPFDPIYYDTTRDIYLHIADAPGCRAMRDAFDHILDCGNILNLSSIPDDTLLGDQYLVEQLIEYSTVPPPVRVLKVDWDDRQAPPLQPTFFTEYSKLVSGNILTACQGGHGRSGTALVCLLMNYIPSYTPFDAICHLRALHCPRAIESKVQHEYINEVGRYLNREPNVEKVKEVKSFREAFLSLTNPDAAQWKEWMVTLEDRKKRRQEAKK